MCLNRELVCLNRELVCLNRELLSLESEASVSQSGTSVSQSGIGTDRNGLLAAGPDLAGYQFAIRLAGFCRTKTGVWRVKYKAAGTCRKI